ncbi:MAG: hypothetical protein KKH72_10255 [Alphaproteobacteria bacterium]|nr:hypothetical protein [Alphaproteobacteria bacterium]
MTGSKSRIERLRRDLRQFASAMTWGQKRAFFIALDIVMLSFAVWLSLSLRLGTWVVPSLHQWGAIVLAPIVAVPVFVRMGLYRAVIRYLPERAFWTIGRAVLLATLAWIGVIFIFEVTRLALIPRSITLIYGILAIALVGGSRFAFKYILHASASVDPGKRNLILYGAGQTGAAIAAAQRLLFDLIAEHRGAVANAAGIVALASARRPK